MISIANIARFIGPIGIGAVLLFAFAIWGLVHFTAAPGTEVSVLFGLATYTKTGNDPDEQRVLSQQLDSTTASDHESNRDPREEKKPVKEAREQGFLFSLEECALLDTKIDCKLKITNEDQDRRLHLIGEDKRSGGTRIYDDLGTEYFADQASIGNKAGDYPDQVMISGIPIDSSFTFQDINPNAKMISVLEIHYVVSGENSRGRKVTNRYKFKIRNISLLKE